uniref:Vacuolar protein sorting-associated protein 13 DH-like domain-containing protein n=1 Tax=Eucampia antarctica TaxID=49252 RepID=A0A7S2WGV8_9STRA
MAVLTLDRNYAQRRDRLKNSDGVSTTFAEGVESGVIKLIRGIVEGVTGVVRAPIKGAEKRGVEGFAKGIGKGLLGLLVKPVIGLSDAATDVMIGVKGSIKGTNRNNLPLSFQFQQIRPRRTFHGQDRTLHQYSIEDATAALLLERTRLAGEQYLSHCDMEDRVALFSVKRLLLLSVDGKELLLVKFKQIRDVEVREVLKDSSSIEWAVLIYLKTPRKNGNEVEVISCAEKNTAIDLSSKLERGFNLYHDSYLKAPDVC